MFIGERSGNINFYRNDGTPKIPSWTLVTENYNSIDVGCDSKPTFIDIDNDGDYDLFIGEQDGGINFYRAVRLVIPGDANHDGKVTDADAAILATNWQSSPATWEMGDFSGDGKVTDADAAMLATHWQEGVGGEGEATALAATVPVPGDANRDGVVDQMDAAILAAHWRMAAEAAWGDGDFNGDGRVSDADAAILTTNWITTVTRPPVEAAARVRLRPALATDSRAANLHRDE